MCRLYWIVAVLSAIALLPRPGAAADHFDLIYADQMYFRGFGPSVDKIVAGPIGFALVVNTSQTPLSAEELTAATFTVTATRDSFGLELYVGNLPNYAPILPAEAVGGVIRENAALATLLEPGETLRNTGQNSVLFAAAWRLHGAPDSASVAFDVLMRLGGQEVRFPTLVEYRGGPISVTYPKATRVSSSQVPAPVVTTTWGRLKALYR
jgi:hypothetical protein